MTALPPTTQDTLPDGALTLVQPARGHGYRVNADALLLTGFASATLSGSARPVRTAARVVDLGAGVGAVGLGLLHAKAARSALLIDRDPVLCELARASARESGLEARATVRCADVAQVRREHVGAAHLVVANPPYLEPGTGRPSAPGVRGARQGHLEAFLDAAQAVTDRRGRVCFVYPAHAALHLLEGLRLRGLEPKRLRFVHARAGAEARVVLVEGTRGKKGGLRVEPPVLEYT